MLSDRVCIYTLIMYTFVSDFTSPNLDLADPNEAFPLPTANILSQRPSQDLKITWDEQMGLKSNSSLIFNGKYQDDFDTREVVVKVVLTDSKSRSEIKQHNKLAGKSIVVDLVYAEKQGEYTVMAFAHYKFDITCLLKPNLNIQAVFNLIRNVFKLVKRCHECGLLHGDITAHNFWVSEQNLLLAGLAEAKEVGSTVSGYAMGMNPMLDDIEGMKQVMLHIMSFNPDSEHTADYHCCMHLLTMMQNEPGMTWHEVKMHPLFWDTGKRISFIEQVNEMSGNSNEQRMRKAREYLQDHKDEVLGCADWRNKIEKIKELEELLNVFSVNGYDGQKISELFRYLRNVLNHYSKYPKAMKALVPKIPEELKPENPDWLLDMRLNIPDTLLNLMLNLFPKLFIESYTTIKKKYGKKFKSDFLAFV